MACFQPGSFSVNGDEGMTVRVVARRDVITADMIRLQQVAEQVGCQRLKVFCLNFAVDWSFSL